MVDRQLTVKQKILEKIELKEFSFKELAPIAGYNGEHGGQNFKRALTKEEGEFDNFQGILDLVEFIWQDNAVEVIGQFSYEISPSRKTARYMLEWLSVNRQLEAFEALLCRMGNCRNSESKEFAKAYSIQYNAQKVAPNIDYDEVIKQVKSFKTNIPELKVFLKIIQTHAYHQKGNYYMTRILSEEIDSYLHELESDYIGTSYTRKLSEVMTWIELRVFNNPVGCRKYADKLINSDASKSFKAFAYFQKGYSYFFVSYDESVKYLSESLRLYKEINSKKWVIKDLEVKIEFAKVYWNKLEKPECYDEKNFLLMSIKNGVNVSKSLDGYKDKLDQSMYLYLKGYNDKNHVVLIESIMEFIGKGDSFLANLPRNALLEMDYEHMHLIDKLMAIRGH